jgi:hypothetical protein
MNRGKTFISRRVLFLEIKRPDINPLLLNMGISLLPIAYCLLPIAYCLLNFKDEMRILNTSSWGCSR